MKKITKETIIDVRMLNFCYVARKVVKATIFAAIVSTIVLLFITMNSSFVKEVRPTLRTKICSTLNIEDKEDEKTFIERLSFFK